MKTKQIKPSKPRNPHAVAARSRNAGAHRPANPARQERRTGKAQLRRLVATGGRDTDN